MRSMDSLLLIWDLEWGSVRSWIVGKPLFSRHKRKEKLRGRGDGAGLSSAVNPTDADTEPKVFPQLTFFLLVFA